jgi:hypothetical protein
VEALLIPKEFVLYSDNHALQFVSQQEKLNQKACEVGGVYAELHIRDKAHFGDCEQGS